MGALLARASLLIVVPGSSLMLHCDQPRFLPASTIGRRANRESLVAEHQSRADITRALNAAAEGIHAARCAHPVIRCFASKKDSANLARAALNAIATTGFMIVRRD